MTSIKKINEYEKIFWQTWKLNPDSKNLLLKYAYEIRGIIDTQKIINFLERFINSSLPDGLCYFNENKDGIEKSRHHNLNHSEIIKIVNTQKVLNNQDIQLILDNELSDLTPVKAPLCKFVLIQDNNNKLVLGCVFSHIIFDGISYLHFIHGLEKYYNDDVVLTRYSADDIISKLDSNNDNHQFWYRLIEKNRHKKNQMNFLIRNEDKSSAYCKKKITLNQEFTQEILTKSKEDNITLFHFLCSSLAVLLYKYNNIDSPLSFRYTHPVSIDATRNTIGCLININPLWVDVDSEKTLKDIYQQVKESRSRAKEHQHYPYLKMPAPQGSNDYSIFINHSPALIGIKVPVLNNAMCELITEPSTDGNYDFGLHYNILNGILHIELSIRSNYVTLDLLTELLTNLEHILLLSVRAPHTLISDLHLIPSQKIISGDVISVDKNNDKHEQQDLSKLLFEKLTQHTNKIAIVSNQATYTYQQVTMDSFQIACYLSEKYGKNIRVGIYLSKSYATSIIILASILRKDCFVPIDIVFPKERIRHIIEEAALDFIIADKNNLLIIKDIVKDYNKIEVIDVGKLFEHSLKNPSGKNSSLTNSELKQIVSNQKDNCLQYILFTSGSTGKPKGVKVTAKNLINFLLSLHSSTLIEGSDHLLSVTPINFDISLLELLLPIFSGASLELLDNNNISNYKSLIASIDNSTTTIVQATPSTWKLLYNFNWRSSKKLKILVGGEELEAPLASLLLKDGHKIYNMYGPTEATIWSSYCEIKNSNQISIGKPIHHTYYSIVNQYMKPLPLGVPGELIIGGECVADGYTNNQNSNFIKHNNVNSYKTGDIVCNYGSGFIKFMARNDSQIKLRGTRIDLKEISSLITNYTKCAQAITLLRQDPSHRLVTFIYGAKKNQDSHNTLHEMLLEFLPVKMVPEEFVFLTELPLTYNKKVDKDYLKKTSIQSIKKHFSKGDQVKKSLNKYKPKTNTYTILCSVFLDFKYYCH